jgi:hypothetical protein
VDDFGNLAVGESQQIDSYQFAHINRRHFTESRFLHIVERQIARERFRSIRVAFKQHGHIIHSAASENEKTVHQLTLLIDRVAAM